MRFAILVLMTGCVGAYAEVQATTIPGAGTGSGSAVGESSIGFAVGMEFGGYKSRLTATYSHDSLSAGSASASLDEGEFFYDHSVYQVMDRAQVRVGAGGGGGQGTSSVGGAGMSKSKPGGSAYGGVGFSYMLTNRIMGHALVGARYISQGTADGMTLAGTGATFRLGVSFMAGDMRPDPMFYVPLEKNRDITGPLEKGGQHVGCKTARSSRPSSGYAIVSMICNGDDITYYQEADGMLVMCSSQFDGQCHALDKRITDSALRSLTRWWKRDEATAPPAEAPPPEPPAETPPAPAAETPPT